MVTYFIFATPWTIAHQTTLSMGFSRQKYQSGLPFSSPGDLPNPGIESRSPPLQAGFTVWATREAPGHNPMLLYFVLRLFQLAVGSCCPLTLAWLNVFKNSFSLYNTSQLKKFFYIIYQIKQISSVRDKWAFMCKYSLLSTCIFF